MALTTASVTRTQACSKCKYTDGMNDNRDTTHSTARDCADLPCADHAFEARRLCVILFFATTTKLLSSVPSRLFVFILFACARLSVEMFSSFTFSPELCVIALPRRRL